MGNPYDYPPDITSVVGTNITETNAFVQWTTGIPSTGRVFYGVTTNYGYIAASAQDMGTNHSANLINLVKGTVYHFQIEATGTNGLIGISSDMTFRTRARIYVYAESPATQELGTIDAPFKSLQAGAEAAKLTGDEILVAVGTYTGSHPEAVLNLDGSAYNLTILGGYAPDFSDRDPQTYETIVDGQYQRRGIRLDEGAKLSVSGLTITRGSGEWGGGVHVRKSAFYAWDCLVRANVSTSGINHLGGGCYATLGSSLALANSCVSSNYANNRGGGFTQFRRGRLWTFTTAQSTAILRPLGAVD